MTDAETQATAHSLPALEWPGERVIKPAKRRLKLRDLPQQASVIRVIAARDFRAKYKQSILGPLWLLIQPLALLVAFFIAFRSVGDVEVNGEAYLPFVLAGLSVWGFFQAAMTIGTSSLISSHTYVRFTPAPRSAFPIAAVIASLPAFAIAGLAAVIAAAATGSLSPRVVLVPFLLVWLVALTQGVVGITSALAVRYRDIVNALPLVLQIGVFVAPVGYPLATLFPTLRFFVELNPLTGVIEAMRWMLLAGYSPAPEAIGLGAATTVLAIAMGWRIFTRLETTMADEI
jgi:homopolymeric O-antigen transport system permease protein